MLQAVKHLRELVFLVLLHSPFASWYFIIFKLPKVLLFCTCVNKVLFFLTFVHSWIPIAIFYPAILHVYHLLKLFEYIIYEFIWTDVYNFFGTLENWDHFCLILCACLIQPTIYYHAWMTHNWFLVLGNNGLIKKMLSTW